MKLRSPIERLKNVFSLIARGHHLGRYLFFGFVFQISAIMTEVIKLYKLAEYQAFGSRVVSMFSSWISNIPLLLAFVMQIVMIPLGIFIILALCYLTLWFGAFLICMYQDTVSEIHMTIPAIARKARSSIRRYFVTVFGKGFIVMLGYALFIIPGIIFTIWFNFSETIAVVEDTSVNALQESRRLVKNRFWQVFGHILFILFVHVAVSGVVLFIAIMFFKSFPFLYLFITNARDVFKPFVGLYLYILYVDLKRISSSTIISEPLNA